MKCRMRWRSRWLNDVTQCTKVELASKKTRANSQQRYSIVNTDVRSLFNITKEGEIYTKTGLDREKRAKYTFTVMLEERRPTTKVVRCIRF